MMALEVTGRSRNVRVTGIDRSLKLVEEDIVEELTDILIGTSIQFLSSEQQEGFFPKKDFITLVDNKINNSIGNVKPFGTIEFKTKLESLQPVLLKAIQLIVERSPERTGAYLNNHVLFKNNVFVAKGFSNIISYINSDTNTKPNDVYRFVNLTPYARKLERYRITKQTRGKLKGSNVTRGKITRKVKGINAVVPAGAYVLANRALRRKFKELKRNIRFSFIPVDPSTARQLDTSGKDTTGYVFKKDGRNYLYPSITITSNAQSVSFNRGFTEQAGL